MEVAQRSSNALTAPAPDHPSSTDPAAALGRSDAGGPFDLRTLTTALWSADDRRRVFARIRAWMIVFPVDALLLLTPILWAPHQARATVTTAVLSMAMLTNCGRYRARLHLSVLDELPNLLSRLLTAAAAVATIIALRYERDSVAEFFLNALIAIGLVILGRTVVMQVIKASRRMRLTVHRTVLIGGGPLAAELAQILDRYPQYGLKVVGFVDDEGGAHGAELFVPRLGGILDLHRVVSRTRADVLLVADGDFSERVLLDSVRTPSCAPCDLLVVPRLHYFHTQTGLADHIGSIPIMRIRTPNLTGPAWAIKRVFDVVGAGALFLLTAPVIAVSALAVRIEGGPGVIFRQPRVGRNGELFDCYKLRSMRPANSDESATTWSIARDDRVGRVGRFLRRTSLDELPQLWNIIRGDMTLVGPRPERPHFVEQFSATYDRYAHRHRVQAGLTGLAQVSGLRGDTPIADRARYDNYYIENWSLWLDVKILIRSFIEPFLGRGR
jgi:exopolysaccharide biosynthesis polyprenyl glycosylphosphotransferase